MDVLSLCLGQPSLTILTKAEMKTRMMVNTPTRVLLVRDWTIFFETVCIAAGKSYKRRNKRCARLKTQRKRGRISKISVLRVYLDARIYGTDEEDVGEYDEDTDVDSQHDRGAARRNTEIQSLRNIQGAFTTNLVDLVDLGWCEKSCQSNQTTGPRPPGFGPHPVGFSCSLLVM